MKIAKKVLSVLLAVALVLGTFAVAVSANGNKDTASHQVKVWLTASALKDDVDQSSVAVWTSTTRYVDAGIKKSWVDSQSNTLTVKPGQKVMIAFHMTTNYYIGNCFGQIWFDSRLLTPTEMYNTQQTPIGRGSTAKVKQMRKFNTNHPFASKEGDEYIYMDPNSATFTPSDSAAMKAEALVDFYQTAMADDGTYYFSGLTDAASVINCGWDQFYYGFGPNPENEITAILTEEDECIFYFPVQVPSDAKAGDTYKFVMPEENIKRSKNVAGKFQVAECKDGVASGSVMNIPSTYYFDDDQYIDLTGANITLTVAGATSSVDYSALQTYYDSVKNTVVANYNNTTAFTTALAAAKTILDDKTADQTAVDAALANLQAGFSAMTIKPADYTALNAAKDAAALISASNYEQDANWTAFQNAYTAAQAIASGLDITHQTEINNAATALSTAITNLTPAEAGASYGLLDAEIALSKNIIDNSQASWYTEATWSAFSTAYAAAVAVPRNLKTSQQGQINDAESALETARLALVEAPANYSLLDSLIAAVDGLNSANYTSTSWALLQEKLATAKAVNRSLKAKDQATVDAAYNALKQACDALAPVGAANLDALNAEIAAGTEYDEAIYTTTSWAAYETVLAAAQAMAARTDLTANEQDIVDDMVQDLKNAKTALVPDDADYTAVNNALARVPSASDLSAYYTPASVATLNAAIDAVQEGKKKYDQSTVDAWATAINSAVDGLELVPADMTALQAAINACASLNYNHYTEASWSAFDDVYYTAMLVFSNPGLTKKDDQTYVDQTTAALNEARENLVPAGASYDKLNAAIASYDALTASHYTSASWTAATAKYNDAKTAASTTYTKDQQDALDAIADALTAAINALVEAPANFAAVDAAATALGNNLTSWPLFLDADYVADANTAIDYAKNDASFRALKAKDQTTVDAVAAELEDLAANPVFKEWDYTAENAAKAEYEALDRSLYTAESLAEVDALFAGIVWTYVQDPRAIGDYTAMSQYQVALKQQNDVKAWKTLLDEIPAAELADYDDLDAAILNAETLLNAGTANYTDASVAALRAALAAGKALSRTLTVDEQATVDAAAKAINDAMPLVEKDANYDALNAAIALAKTKVQDAYTAASWAVMTEKLAAAEAVAEGLKISSQPQIDKATNELNAAIAALVEKPTDTKGAVTNVDWTPSTNVKNTFYVTVKNVGGTYAAKVQFVNPNGTTRTFARRDAAVTVTSYKADGTICHELDDEAAYEIWAINTKMTTDVDVKVIAKFDYKWESKDLAYSFKVTLAQRNLNTAVYSVTPEALEGDTVGVRVNVDVVTGADVQRVRTVMENGSTLTCMNYTLSEDGNTKTFSCPASIKHTGENVIKVQVKYNNTWHDYSTFTYVVSE